MNKCDITLYGILDPSRSAGRALPELARAAVEGGVTILQYRDKQAGIRQMIDTGRAIKAAIAESDVPLLINDRVDVALATGADGVHLGQDDMPVEDARKILGPDAAIGLTIKNPDQAANAPVDLINYGCIGGVFRTLSKDNSAPIGIDGWRETAIPLCDKAPNLPIGAIAGIGLENVADVMAAGADGVAVISSLFMQQDVVAAAREMLASIDEMRTAN